MFVGYYYTDIMQYDGWEAGRRVSPAAMSGVIAAVSKLVLSSLIPQIFVTLTLSRLPAKVILIACDLLGG